MFFFVFLQRIIYYVLRDNRITQINNIIMKRITTILSVLLLIFAPLSLYAEEVTIGGICYDLRITNHTATVIPSGSYNPAGFPYYNNYSGNITIPAQVTNKGEVYTVTDIGKRAFYYCSNLNTVSLPATVTKIGDEAFYYCTSLSSVGDITNVTNIGNAAFYYCTGLASIAIGDNVTKIETKSFFNCSALSNVVLGNGLTTIKDYAFFGCESLENMDIPNSVTSIESRAFAYCSNLTTINLGSNLKSIGQRAFAYCYNLPSITLPASVKSIGGWAFMSCYLLNEVIALGETPASIENHNTFPNRSNMNLYVPYGCSSSYSMVEFWEDFGNIYEMDPVDLSSVSVNISEYGVATFCSEYPLDFTDVEGLVARIATNYDGNTGMVVLEAVGEVPALTGLFLTGEPGTYEVPVKATDVTYDNMFVGTTSDIMLSPTEGEFTNFILYADKKNGASFRPLSTTGPLKANRAYLQIPTDLLIPSTNLNIVVDEGGQTGIIFTPSPSSKSDEEDSYYTLDGRKLNGVPTQRGMYIHNGKKVVVN